MPGLDLLAEDDADAGFTVFLCEKRPHGFVESLELLGAEGADVVEVEFESVCRGAGGGGGGEELAGEFGGEGHCYGCVCVCGGEEDEEGAFGLSYGCLISTDQNDVAIFYLSRVIHQLAS